MENNYQSPRQIKTNTLAIVSLILAFFVPLISLILAIISLNQIKKTKEKGKGLAIASLVLSIVFILIVSIILLIIFLAVPSLQQNSRDLSRKNDLALIASDIYNYQTTNQGILPTSNQLDNSDLSIITNINNIGEPTTDTAIYRIGVDCAGIVNDRVFSVSIKLEDNTITCVD
jgi:peptidyl-prolyl cis-trans isomerase B (cyclophilin B)